ncbi:MAG: YybS family protein [Gemmatimonadaceae bacterium]|nr:YybS family protein [Gemmatimonadaceae bacterium]
MTAAPAPEPPKQRWRGLIFALIGFIVVSIVPVLGFYAPVKAWHVMLTTIIAACAVVGWIRGAPAMTAVVWLAAALWLLFRPGVDGDAYYWLERGWILLVAGIFGLAAVLGPDRPFFGRALLTVLAGFVIALAVLGARAGSFERLQTIVSGEFVTRNQATLEAFDAGADEIVGAASNSEGVAQNLERTKERLRIAPQISGVLAPALLALQTLAALALGWAVFQRLSRVRIGPPLAPLRTFRFNDQLVWGLAVGLTILLLPAFAEAQAVGLNLVVFFAMLYFVRGLGVLAWVTKGGVFVVLAVLFSLFPPALGALGLSDTWLDWRSRAKAA